VASDTRASSWSSIQQFVKSVSQVVDVLTLCILFLVLLRILPLLHKFEKNLFACLNVSFPAWITLLVLCLVKSMFH